MQIFFFRKIFDIIALEQLVHFYTKSVIVPVCGQNAHPLEQNAYPRVCCLTQWSNLSLIIAYDNSNSIKITISLILGDIVVYTT